MSAFALCGCAGMASSGLRFDASDLMTNPTLLVATTRKPVSAVRAKPWFGPERASAMTVARAKLTPPDDGPFSLASVRASRLAEIELVAQIGDLIAPAAGGHDVLVYVHGYNTTFETAVLDAARLSDGIKFVGDTMMFSWPSRASLLDYGYDRESAMWSRDALQEVLDGLIASPVVGHIHIVAHSIGTMLTMEALRQLYAQLGEEAVNKIGAVVFASPDIDMDGFSSSVQRIGPLEDHRGDGDQRPRARGVPMDRRRNYEGRRGREGTSRAHGDPRDRCLASRAGASSIMTCSCPTPRSARSYAAPWTGTPGSGLIVLYFSATCQPFEIEPLRKSAKKL
jgi:pimeloyl-ACP methyl ester carboxylesterase